MAALVAGPAVGAAQSGVGNEGALFLLVPVGARSVALGQAVAASEPGSEGIWENPASMARLTRRELALNHSTSIAATLDALVFVLPRGKIGVISAAAYLLDYGAQDITDITGNVIGQSIPRSVILAASYAATFGKRVRAGVSYKFLQERQDCSGDCTSAQTHVPSTSAFDVGVQATVDDSARITIGAYVRNLGFPLQINDVEQADPLPARLHLGAQYLFPAGGHLGPDASALVSAEFVTNPQLDRKIVRIGSELSYRQQLFVRVGYASGNDQASGISIGFGLQRGGIALDFARTTGGVSSDAGKPPTFVSLRFRF